MYHHRLKKTDFLSLSSAITTIFPCETSSEYFLPYGESGKSTPTGKLYQQYTQYRRKLASRNVITIRERKTKSKNSEGEPPAKQLYISSSESLALAMLKTAIDVDDERVLYAWRCTKAYRANRLKNKSIPTSELIAEFPILSQKNSYKLVSV